MPKTKLQSAEITEFRHAKQDRAEKTRQMLIDAAFEEIYISGFRSASLAAILERANCTKGALYHHFPDKHALGLAAVMEKIDEYVFQIWQHPLAESKDPIACLKQIILSHMDGSVSEILNNQYISMEEGCPISKLSNEMSSIDESFRIYLSSALARMRGAVCRALEEGQASGSVGHHFDAEEAAGMAIAVHQGVCIMVTTSRDPDLAESCANGVFQYLDFLKPQSQQ